jgi:uncharacterized repeat protein (TIGR03803 family)
MLRSIRPKRANYRDPTSENGSGGATLDAQGDVFFSAGPTIWEVVKGTGAVTAVVTTVGTGTNGEVYLTLGSDGQFYGTTSTGGDHGNGTVFELSTISTPDPSSMLMTLLISAIVGVAIVVKRCR